MARVMTLNGLGQPELSWRTRSVQLSGPLGSSWGIWLGALGGLALGWALASRKGGR
jgi:hypothetical protein